MIAILDNRCEDDVLSTTMYLVEQTVTARPLTAVSDDPEDLTAFSPNHFLLKRVEFMPSSERQFATLVLPRSKTGPAMLALR